MSQRRPWKAVVLQTSEVVLKVLPCGNVQKTILVVARDSAASHTVVAP